MFQPSRRGFLTGLGAAFVAAPAVIRTPGLLMPVKPALVQPPAIRMWGSFIGGWFVVEDFDQSTRTFWPATYDHDTATHSVSILGAGHVMPLSSPFLPPFIPS